MPRLEEGQMMPQSRFKKRRAWLEPEELENESITSIEKSKIEEKSNNKVTNLDRSDSKIVTKEKQNYNNKISDKNKEFVEPFAHKIELNNVIVTKKEHNQNNTEIEKNLNNSILESLNSFFIFIDNQKRLLGIFEINDPKFLILTLSETQKKIFWHTAIHCMERGATNTGPIEIEDFYRPLQISFGVVRTTLNRLIERGIFQRERGKRGKNGFTIISLPKLIFDTTEILAQEYKKNFFDVSKDKISEAR